jgi:methyltransferase
MLLEARRSRINERALRAAGAVEPAGDVYRVMQIVYPGSFAAMLLEAWLRGSASGGVPIAGVVVFAAAKALKYWAIAALGQRWTFRVLVPPGSRRIVRGPYRMLRHPNYVAVMGELVGFSLLAHARYSGAAAALLFGLLILARIRVEERALALPTR